MTQTYPVTETPHIVIPLSDGTRLSARLWRPEGAGPVPAILEYLPYRKRDGTAERDAITHPYMAARGYACIRVDMRGCGDSAGLFEDEYSAQEMADGVEVVTWLSQQAWCDGAVGMMGISWGGFNGLQIAALAPPPLKAVVTICSTVDRFADDIHYKGGIMLTENPGWAATALSWFSMPPDPEIVGENWREIWLERLAATPFLAETWSQHQTRDAYWRHGSVCEDYAAIQAAVLTVGGWHDGYRNTMAHLLENLSSPVKGIVGPWNHKYPHIAVPGPQIDFLGEMLRWWDQYLKGIDRGCAEDPDLRAYLMDSIAPQPAYSERPGDWVGVDWPTGDAPEVLHLTDQGLTTAPPTAESDWVVHPRLELGQSTGEYFPGYGALELPLDQTQDDALATCFDSGALPALDLLGAPRLHLTLTSDKPAAQIAVRLCDLRPDGTSALIAHGFLNLTLRDDWATPRAMPLDTPVQITVDLDQCGYRLPAGHRLRLAVSSSYWPFVWPEAETPVLTLVAGRVELPVLGARQAVRFDPAPVTQTRRTRRNTAGSEHKSVTKDVGLGTITTRTSAQSGAVEDLETGLITESTLTETFSINATDPTTAMAQFQWTRSLGRGDWQVSSRAEISMTGTAEAFEIDMHLTAYEGAETVFAQKWDAQLPRVNRLTS